MEFHAVVVGGATYALREVISHAIDGDVLPTRATGIVVVISLNVDSLVRIARVQGEALMKIESTAGIPAIHEERL